MATGEWHHETITHVGIYDGAVLIVEGRDAYIRIPAAHGMDNWPELEEMQHRAQQNCQTIVGTRFSWRVVDQLDHSTELQVMLGEQRIDTTIGSRQDWTVTQKSTMHICLHRPPLGAIRRI